MLPRLFKGGSSTLLERILFIDDSETEAEMVKLALRSAGFNEPILWIGSIPEALAYLEGTGKFSDRSKFPVPDVLLLDLRMPEMSGLDVLRWVRQHPHLEHLAVIVVTAMRDTSVIAEAY